MWHLQQAWQRPGLLGNSGSQGWPCPTHRYQRLSEAVEFLFPPVARGPSMDLAHPEYSSFCYWREPLPAADLNALA